MGLEYKLILVDYCFVNLVPCANGSSSLSRRTFSWAGWEQRLGRRRAITDLLGSGPGPDAIRWGGVWRGGAPRQPASNRALYS